jgi:transcription elongation GreA/GreB family factor
MNLPNKQSVIVAIKNKISATKANITESLESERFAIQQETKSSAGDKYETQREMIQADIRRSEAQLEETKMNEEMMEHFHDFKSMIILGTLVQLSQGNNQLFVFIGPAVGDVLVEKQKIKVISSISPFGQLLMGKKLGDVINFNQKSFQIVDCY